jgi:hypothetical protein
MADRVNLEPVHRGLPADMTSDGDTGSINVLLIEDNAGDRRLVELTLAETGEARFPTAHRGPARPLNRHPRGTDSETEPLRCPQRPDDDLT